MIALKERMKFETPNITDKNIDKIAELFPSVITESVDENGKLKKAINFDMLRQLLSEDVAEGDEAYEFTWVGKKAAIVEANKPIRKTLRPCPHSSLSAVRRNLVDSVSERWRCGRLRRTARRTHYRRF